MKKLILALALLAGCREDRVYACGDMVPVTYDKYGGNTSLTGETCPGHWKPVPTGPWYRWECGEVKP